MRDKQCMLERRAGYVEAKRGRDLCQSQNHEATGSVLILDLIPLRSFSCALVSFEIIPLSFSELTSAFRFPKTESGVVSLAGVPPPSLVASA